MPIDANNAIAAAGRPPAAANADVDREEIKRLAQQFEAMLMTQMLREMRRSMLDEEDEQGGLGAGAMFDTGDIEFGSAMSRGGGFGFAHEMLAVFERQIVAMSGKAGDKGAPRTGSVTNATTEVGPSRAESAGGAGATGMSLLPVAGVAGVVGQVGLERATVPGETSLADVTTDGSVSSTFGWRRDPLSGATRFHSGVDIALAYGRPVKAAAEGIVAFAGTQNGYGRTVIIDHGDGRQTRYAHLSEPLVQIGDAVAEGQVVGKSGNSGRSTGPHLHFELLVNGRAVDPRGEL